MLLRRLAIVLLLVLGLAGSADAKAPPGTVAPPGNSGIDQYVETVPTARGPATPGQGDRRPGAPARKLPASTRSALAAQGADGAAVAALVEAAGPRAGREGKAAKAQRDDVVEAARGDGGVLGTAVSRGVGGAGADGMGAALPIALVAAAAGCAALAVARRRRATRA